MIPVVLSFASTSTKTTRWCASLACSHSLLLVFEAIVATCFRTNSSPGCIAETDKTCQAGQASNRRHVGNRR